VVVKSIEEGAKFQKGQSKKHVALERESMQQPVINSDGTLPAMIRGAPYRVHTLGRCCKNLPVGLILRLYETMNPTHLILVPVNIPGEGNV
jgi:hypothetical protein